MYSINRPPDWPDTRSRSASTSSQESQMSIATVNQGGVYRFSAETTDGEGNMKALLGGKGAGLAVMTQLGVPVPPGFTIPTSACRHYLKHKRLPKQLEYAIDTAVSWLEGKQRQIFGDVERPMLVS